MAMKGPSPPQSFTLGAEKKKSRVREEKGAGGVSFVEELIHQSCLAVSVLNLAEFNWQSNPYWCRQRSLFPRRLPPAAYMAC